MISKNLTLMAKCYKIILPHQNIKPSISSIYRLPQYFRFSKTKFRQEKQLKKNEVFSIASNEDKNEFLKNYIKMNLSQNCKKPQTSHINILINLKVTFPQQGNKQTKITKIQTLQESNEPSIVMILNKSQFPPEDNRANEEIIRFWNEILDERWCSENLLTCSSCDVISGKTSKRKNIAFTIELKHKPGIQLENIFEDFNALITSFLTQKS